MKGPVALTGSTGFVGQHVVRVLGDAGLPLRLLVRDERQSSRFPMAEIVLGALDDRGALDRLLTGAGAVVHLAGAITAPDRAAFFAANAQGTRDIANLASSHGVSR